jgi:nucleotide-binding universal stress UspA family protein
MNLAFKTFVVATDFSASADLALEYARAIATRFQALLHLVHVVQEPYPIGVEGDVPDVDAFRQSLLQAAHNRMTSLLATCPGATGEVLVGPPAARIVEAATAHDADLIVMGTRGRGALSSLVLGSVASRVVRTASCPVLTIRDRESRVASRSRRARAVAAHS